MTATRVRTRTRTKSVVALSEQELKECRFQTLNGRGGWGQMQHKLDLVRSACKKHGRDVAFATMLKDEDGQVVGWALTFEKYPSSSSPERYMDSFFFVDPQRRREGIGTMLYRAVRRRFGIVAVHAWDERSTGFFDAVGAK